MSMTEIRVRTRMPKEFIDSIVGKIITEKESDLRLTGPSRVLKPDGRPLCVYLPKAIPQQLLDDAYETLHSLRSFQTDNRGPASGVMRAPSARGGRTRTRTKPVSSAIIGAIDPAGPKNYCRLTAWTGEEWNQFEGLFPLFQAIGDQFAKQVPERYEVQMGFVRQTKPEWVIRGTPFTTITVNNSYATGVHTDAGDLEAGFSNLTVLRRGRYSGGIFTFPEYRVSVDMQEGDLLLMDAHDWHGNTQLVCEECGQPMEQKWHDTCKAERISVVCYFRTKMLNCGSFSEEEARALAFADRGTERGKRLA